MAASDRRPAVWPWLVMPLIVLLLFYALHRVQHPAAPAAVPAAATGSAGVNTPQ
jgi:fumarate reductase subunit D